MVSGFDLRALNLFQGLTISDPCFGALCLRPHEALCFRTVLGLCVWVQLFRALCLDPCVYGLIFQALFLRFYVSGFMFEALCLRLTCFEL